MNSNLKYMQKPSERIKEIMVEMAKEKGNWWLENKIGAIWEYLDEEYERNKPCEHKEWIEDEHPSTGQNYRYCANCKIVLG